MLVNGNNFIFTHLGRLFFASTPPPHAMHHRHPKCGVLHGDIFNYALTKILFHDFCAK
jgi:hypothetical protein